jgi:hypothetical protein
MTVNLVVAVTDARRRFLGATLREARLPAREGPMEAAA